MDIQAMIDGMSKRWQDERAETQMTLGELISELEKMAPDFPIEGIGHPHSYRGYYSDLSFERTSGKRKACELLADCKKSMGKAFGGYKGGSFQMGELTPIWIADYGCCGVRIMSLRPDGTFAIAEDSE